MPLMYVPFIMYASGMDFLTRGFVVPRDSTDPLTDEEQQTVDTRTRA